MAYTAADLTAIEVAILALGKGERVAAVTFSSGKSVQYTQTSLQDLLTLKSIIARETSSNRRQILVSSSKGL